MVRMAESQEKKSAIKMLICKYSKLVLITKTSLVPSAQVCSVLFILVVSRGTILKYLQTSDQVNNKIVEASATTNSQTQRFNSPL